MDIAALPPIPLIAILAGGALATIGIVLYKIISSEASPPDPFRERSESQRSYMNEVVERSKWEIGARTEATT